MQGRLVVVAVALMVLCQLTDSAAVPDKGRWMTGVDGLNSPCIEAGC